MSPTISTTSTTQRLLQRSSRMNPSTQTLNRRTRAMRNSTMSLLEKRYLHHSSFRSEKTQRTWSQTYHSHEEKFVASSVLFSTRTSMGRPEHEPSSELSQKTEIKSRLRKRASQASPWKTKKSKFLLKVRYGIQKHELQAESDKKKYPGINWNYWFSANGSRSYYNRVWAIQARSTTTSRRTIRIKSGSSWNSYQKSFMRWKNWREFKNYESMNFREGDWSKIRTLLMNSRPEFRNYKVKSIVWMNREILRMPSQFAVDHATFPVNGHYFPSYRDPGGLLSRNNQPPDIWNSQGISGNVFANPRASSSSPYPWEFNTWISNVTEDTPVLTSTGTRYMWWTSNSRHSLESEISDGTVSRKFIRPWGGKILKELWGRPTKTADLGTSFW